MIKPDTLAREFTRYFETHGPDQCDCAACQEIAAWSKNKELMREIAELMQAFYIGWAVSPQSSVINLMRIIITVCVKAYEAEREIAELSNLTKEPK